MTDNRRQPLNYRLLTKHINAEVKHFCERSALPNLGQLYKNTLQEQTEKSQLQMNKLNISVRSRKQQITHFLMASLKPITGNGEIMLSQNKVSISSHPTVLA